MWIGRQGLAAVRAEIAAIDVSVHGGWRVWCQKSVAVGKDPVTNRLGSG
jgi:hypothetical protein